LRTGVWEAATCRGEGTGGGEGTREQERWRDWRPRAVCSRMVQRKDGTEPSLRHRWSQGRIRGQCIEGRTSRGVWGRHRRASREEGQSNSRAFIRRAVRHDHPCGSLGWEGGGRLTQRHRRRHRRRSRERRELLRGRMPRWQRASATRTQGGSSRGKSPRERGEMWAKGKGREDRGEHRCVATGGPIIRGPVAQDGLSGPWGKLQDSACEKGGKTVVTNRKSRVGHGSEGEVGGHNLRGRMQKEGAGGGSIRATGRSIGSARPLGGGGRRSQATARVYMDDQMGGRKRGRHMPPLGPGGGVVRPKGGDAAMAAEGAAAPQRGSRTNGRKGAGVEIGPRTQKRAPHKSSG
jgi:hypothetical protein